MHLQHADESLQSLQFGARAACVRNKPMVNERLQMRALTAELLAALEVGSGVGLWCRWRGWVERRSRQ